MTEHSSSKTQQLPPNEHDKNLYEIVRGLREVQHRPISRIMLCGYFNQSACQKEKLDIEPYLSELVKPFLPRMSGYLLVKGMFYLHILETEQPEQLNKYMDSLAKQYHRNPTLYNELNVLYMSQENPDRFFKNWFCENIFQTGPNLGETDKLDQQISDRCFEIYSTIGDGGKKKQKDSSVKVANECPLNVDDMMMLVSHRFMTIEEYESLYLTEIEVTNDAEQVFPIRPPLLKNLEFMETPDYISYHN